MSKFDPILCLDFDGVLHSYKSGWVAAHFIPDPPVPGAFEFLHQAIQHFNVQIYSSRSHQDGGIPAMITWVEYWARKELDNVEPDYKANAVITAICNDKDAWPKAKPPAMLTIDDRALTFDGTWPDVNDLLKFKPWNKK